MTSLTLLDDLINTFENQCICGQNLIKVDNAPCSYHGTGFVCDLCDVTNRTMIAWHCDEDIHRYGFDICDDCIHRFNPYALTNRFCYCCTPLRRYKSDGTEGSLRCPNCCRVLSEDTLIYTCFEKECIYRKASNIGYYVCSTCYRQAPISDCDHENENSFIYRKFCASINTISYCFMQQFMISFIW